MKRLLKRSLGKKISFEALATSRTSSHTIFWVGDKYRIAGAGFDISIKLNHINPVPINSSLMTAEAPLPIEGLISSNTKSKMCKWDLKNKRMSPDS